ncbi:hypothetical protein PC129_g24424 [Phytophthora cactorum]|uniref:Uncharacterized protein n=1 Tax=Phytophthora cactorum TaxID=29920 RepID=A0A8T1A2L3_9STRA|nr:hypothetical protein PC112_g24942 [Phytophthora cactorum]KAG3058589.1 hypothetical protein PI125_g25199 [Phytophthora idaei]KAG2867389.1 hypothetical protein PC114_g27881 [Phytophthora cactorum]KAG2870768.1 hypothetical protein PC117_g28421 [Phytophthora cactorum]KAG2937975.1 hypothetical protein PC118_g26032 [Phytophthora cactorum]
MLESSSYLVLVAVSTIVTVMFVGVTDVVVMP